MSCFGHILTIAQTYSLNRASLNPARDFGPRLVTVVARWGTIGFTDFLPYLLGPIFGGPIGAFFADKVLML
jgi:glycerol uptake facilitator-like aquaporin